MEPARPPPGGVGLVRDGTIWAQPDGLDELNMRRPSIRTLMASIIVTAVGLASLRNADDLWVGIWLLTAVAAVGAAILGAAILRGRERAGWAGFALFCGGYLVISVGPSLGDTYGPRLGTTHALRYVHGRISVAPDATRNELALLEQERPGLVSQVQRVKRVTRNSNDPALLLAERQLRERDQRIALVNASPFFDDFRLVGHALFALLAGVVGALVAGRFYDRRQSTETAPAPH